MTTKEEDVVFVVLLGEQVTAWNVVEGRVLMRWWPNVEKKWKKKGIEYEKRQILEMGVKLVSVLAIGMEGLRQFFEASGEVIEKEDPRWGELFEKHGMERAGYGMYEREKWSWGGVDVRRE